jgi:hypothetical protein
MRAVAAARPVPTVTTPTIWIAATAVSSVALALAIVSFRPNAPEAYQIARMRPPLYERVEPRNQTQNRWLQSEIADQIDEDPAEPAGGLTRAIRTVRFTRPVPLDAPRVDSDRPEPAAVGFSLASADARVVELDKVRPEPSRRDKPGLENVEEYLWDVYQRAPVKKDGSGDFTWKDAAAAERMNMSIRQYVISGMDADFREQLYHAGRAMDADGIKWSILSGFRDDYRQTIASGLKAGAKNSRHGGSVRTGGYGHGIAVDVTGADGTTMEDVWRWLDQHGAKYGLHRPMPGYDPAHVQSRGDWRALAQNLRKQRIRLTQQREREEAANAKLANAAAD